MKSREEWRAEEALAEASADVAIGMVRDALAAYDRGELPVATVLATISTADHYAWRAMTLRWDFLEATRDQR